MRGWVDAIKMYTCEAQEMHGSVKLNEPGHVGKFGASERPPKFGGAGERMYASAPHLGMPNANDAEVEQEKKSSAIRDRGMGLPEGSETSMTPRASTNTLRKTMGGSSLHLGGREAPPLQRLELGQAATPSAVALKEGLLAHPSRLKFEDEASTAPLATPSAQALKEGIMQRPSLVLRPILGGSQRQSATKLGGGILSRASSRTSNVVRNVTLPNDADGGVDGAQGAPVAQDELSAALAHYSQTAQVVHGDSGPLLLHLAELVRRETASIRERAQHGSGGASSSVRSAEASSARMEEEQADGAGCGVSLGLPQHSAMAKYRKGSLTMMQSETIVEMSGRNTIRTGDASPNPRGTDRQRSASDEGSAGPRRGTLDKEADQIVESLTDEDAGEGSQVSPLAVTRSLTDPVVTKSRVPSIFDSSWRDEPPAPSTPDSRLPSTDSPKTPASETVGRPRNLSRVGSVYSSGI